MAKFHHCVNILEVCTVTPPPGSAVPASLPLTFFDILWLRFPPVQRLFFYKTPAPFDAVVSNLKKSLSAVLQHYLPLAGAIVWPENSPKPIVETAAGDGVLLTVAESDADFHHLVSDVLREAAEFHPLVPELPAAEDRAAVVALQVTWFGKAGFCIGISSHHAILDGRSSTSFVKTWARVCKNLVAGGGETSEPIFPAAEMTPFYDRGAVEDPAGLEGIYLREWLANGGPNNRSLKFMPPSIPPNLTRGTFKLSPRDIKKLKQLVLNHRNPAHPPMNISTFTVAMAYTWVCSAVSDASSPPDRKLVFGMSVDARRRLDPPLPTTYFGNCVVGQFATVEKAKLVGQHGVVAAVEAISETIKSLEEYGPLNGAENWVSLIMQAMAESAHKLLSTAGSPRFEVYGVDFGWETPEKVEIVSIDETGAVSISDGRDGGVELGWAGKRDVMEKFAAVFAEGLQ